MAPITTRRELLKAGGAMAVASALNGRTGLFGEDERKIRVGFVGVGNRGSGLLDIALHMPGIEVPGRLLAHLPFAVCGAWYSMRRAQAIRAVEKEHGTPSYHNDSSSGEAQLFRLRGLSTHRP